MHSAHISLAIEGAYALTTFTVTTVLLAIYFSVLVIVHPVTADFPIIGGVWGVAIRVLVNITVCSALLFPVTPPITTGP